MSNTPIIKNFLAGKSYDTETVISDDAKLQSVFEEIRKVRSEIKNRIAGENLKGYFVAGIFF
ncbi:MAG: hypothetical protein WCJ19_01400 [bacterium]